MIIAAASERTSTAALTQARGPLKNRRMATCGRYRKAKRRARVVMERMRRGRTLERRGGRIAGWETR